RPSQSDRHVETAQHRPEPLGEVSRHTIDHESFRPERACAIPAPAQQRAIEYKRARWHVEHSPVGRYRIAMHNAATVQPSRLARFANGLRASLRLGLDTALPPLCPACRDLVADNGLCPACWSKLAFISAPYCP